MLENLAYRVNSFMLFTKLESSLCKIKTSKMIKLKFKLENSLDIRNVEIVL